MMSNLVDYVKINGNKSYKEYPFNEIDASIYSALSYIDMSSFYEKNKTFEELYNLSKNRFSLKITDKFNKENKELFEIISSSLRYKDNIIKDYKRIVNKDTQFSALSIGVPHYFKFISFEGTEDDLAGWRENFMMGYMYPNLAQEEAIKFLKDNIKLSDLKVYVGGHSKGGNLALSAVMEQSFLKRFKIDTIFNFDGPGFKDNLIDLQKFERIEKKIKNYYPKDSYIGMIFNSKGEKKFIKSNALSIYEHDIHSWLIIDNKFLETNQGKNSQKFHERVNNLFLKHSNEEYKFFIETFFTLLNGSGYFYKSDLKELNVEKMKNIINNAINLTDEEKKVILELFKTFLLPRN